MIPGLPNLNFSGAQSRADSRSSSGPVDGSGGAGVRAPVINVATGSSRLSASTGGDTDYITLMVFAGALALGWVLFRRK